MVFGQRIAAGFLDEDFVVEIVGLVLDSQ